MPSEKYRNLNRPWKWGKSMFSPAERRQIQAGADNIQGAATMLVEVRADASVLGGAERLVSWAGNSKSEPKATQCQRIGAATVNGSRAIRTLPLHPPQLSFSVVTRLNTGASGLWFTRSVMK